MLPQHQAIVGGVTDLDTLKALPNLKSDTSVCDFLEFRIDALLGEEALLDQRLKAQEHPLIITVRDPAEGGIGDLSHDRRRKLMAQHAAHASLLDVEIRNLAPFADVVEAIHTRGEHVIGSFHDFEATPDVIQLTRTINEGRDHGADLIKLAVTLRNAHDLHALLHVFEEQQAEGPMAIMGMGPLGMGSRVLFAECGNLLTYTYLQRANAPGQWSAQRMRTLFEDFAIERLQLDHF